MVAFRFYLRRIEAGGHNVLYCNRPICVNDAIKPAYGLFVGIGDEISLVVGIGPVVGISLFGEQA